MATKVKQKPQEKCLHNEAFVYGVFQNKAHETLYLILECPNCGQELILPGSPVDHLDG